MQPLQSQLEAIQKLQPPHYSKGIQKVCRDGQFSKYVLSRITEIIKTNI